MVTVLSKSPECREGYYADPMQKEDILNYQLNKVILLLTQILEKLEELKNDKDKLELSDKHPYLDKTKA